MPDRPTCSCGHDRYHHTVRADLKYGGWAWLAILNGASGTPKAVTFRCSACGETFETTRDPVVLKEYRRYPYVMRRDEE